MHYGDIADSTNQIKLLYRIQPDEVYHLAAQSHVGVSFDIPEYTADVTALSTIRILEAIRETGCKSKLYRWINRWISFSIGNDFFALKKPGLSSLRAEVSEITSML